MSTRTDEVGALLLALVDRVSHRGGDTLALMTEAGLTLPQVLFLTRLRQSRMGRAFDAVKLDETAAEAMGIDVTRAKLTAFAAGAFVAGVGGGLYAHHAVFIQYDNFDFKRSVDIAMYMVLGGMDVLSGPLLGAFIITYLSTALQFLADWRWEVWGSIVILVMIFRPQGILGRDTLSIRRWRRASPVTPG